MIKLCFPIRMAAVIVVSTAEIVIKANTVSL